MEQAVGVEPSELAAIAATRLGDGQFDQAPVMEGGAPIGFVLTRDLVSGNGALVRDAMRLMRQGNIVSADAPVGDLLDWIVDPGFLFVVDGRRVVGFVSVSDFNKQPVRGYLYLQVAALETNLAEFVRRVFTGCEEEILSILNTLARKQVRRRQEADRAAHFDTDLVAYLDFAHLLLVSRSDHRLAEAIQSVVGDDDEQFSEQLRDLRNRVMHPIRGLVANKGDLIELRNLETKLDRLSKHVDRVMRGMADAD